MHLALENGGAFDAGTRPLWLTRDDTDDGLSDDVELWTARPQRIRGVWVPICQSAETFSEAMQRAHGASVPVHAARIIFGTIPDTGIECVVLR